MWYQVTLQMFRSARECYQAMPSEAMSEEDWQHTDVSCDNNVRLVKWRHRIMLATSASSDKTAFAFNFLDVLCVLKSSNDACHTEIHISVHSYQVYQARPQTGKPLHSYAGSGLAW